MIDTRFILEMCVNNYAWIIVYNFQSTFSLISLLYDITPQ